MSHEIETRDRQVGHEPAWHGLTIINEEVTPELAHPYELEPRKLYFNRNGEFNVRPFEAGHSILIASDDELPVGPPFNPSTYTPNSIQNFWDNIKHSMADVCYDVVSAGSVRNRQLVFASVKVSDGFTAGGREFRDYLSFIDGFDKKQSLQALYSNICVVCSNTFHAAMNRGTVIAKFKHSKNFKEIAKGLPLAVQEFLGQSEDMKTRLEHASTMKVSIDEAAWWFTGFMHNHTASPKALVKKRDELVDLFRNGHGNEGRNRLDAFSAVTERFTRGAKNFERANFNGSANRIKEAALSGLENWGKIQDRGREIKNSEALVA